MMKQLFAAEWQLTRKALLSTLQLTGVTMTSGAVFIASKIDALQESGKIIIFLSGLSVLPAIIIILMASYWRSMHGQYAVLTHSIPVRARQLFAVKALSLLGMSIIGLAWMGIHYIVWTMTVGFARDYSAQESLDYAWTNISEFWNYFVNGPLLPVTVLTVISAAFVAVTLLALLSIGASPRFPGKGSTGPILAFVLYYLVAQIGGTIGTFFIPLGVRINEAGEGSIAYEMMITHVLEAGSFNEQMDYVGVGSMLVYIALSVISIVWAVRGLERHLHVG